MKNCLLVLAMLLMTVSLALAQRTLTGSVVDDKTNEALPGANILIVGTNSGTTTDAKGAFSITVPASATALQVSFIGYANQQISIGNQSNIAVRLVAGGQLAEVVVLGYTTARRQDLTGAVAIIEPAVTKATSSGNPLQALQGRTPGLYIEKTGTPSGEASRILIRGANTLGNNDPLFIIDGVPTKRPQVFQSLNPTTIQSVQVLKDASSASIYGARASNGVIVVTTNNGSNANGKLNVQFNTSITAQTERPERYKMLNAVNRGRALWQASVNDRVDPASAYGEIYTFNWNRDFNNPQLTSVTPNPFVGGNPNVPVGDTDWQNELYQTAYVTNNDLTISGGTKNSSLLVNLSYFNNSGLVKFTGYNRLTGRINGVTGLYDGRFKLGVNLQLTTSRETPVTTDLGGAPTPGLAVTLAPTIPMFTKTGEYAGPLGSGYSDRNNPVFMQYINRWDKINRTFVFGNVYAELEPIRGLFLRSSLGMDNAGFTNKNIEQSFQNGFIARSLNSLTLNNNRFLSLTWTNTARYNFALGNHSFNVLAGIEAIRDNLDDIVSYRENFAVQTEDFFVLSAASGNASSTGGSTGSRLLSQFARIDYNFNDRYLAALTLRRDGSSRFGADNRYGFFPAASIGWRIDKESFMANQNLFSNLKLRAGVGRIGNQDIGDLARFGLFEPRYGTLASQVPNGHNGFFDQYWNVGTAYDLNGTNSGTLPSGFVQTQGENTALRWETTDELNVGLDFAFLNGSLVGSFDYFTRQTRDILIKPPVASAVGEGQLKFVNGATKTNKGFELLLTYYGKPKGDFTYNVSANFARFRDRITVLPEEVRSAFAGNAVTTIIGRSQFDLFGYRTDGIFQSQAEVDAHARQVGAAPGRIRYRDLNGDNRIDALDQEFYGTTLPALEYGTRFEFGYKNFDLSIFGSGVAGRTGFDPYTFYNNFIRGRDNVGPGVFDAWTPQNTASRIPALTLSDGNNETRPSDYFNVNTSYYKLRNAQLGYTFRRETVGRIGLSGVRVFLMGENLFWIKSGSFLGPDPERVDVNTVPVPRAFTLGLNVSL
ncbi:SusC/RagA family TonB-linked outer membrane protein [Spirosoma montaniterrae]|uniref:SusC/RagA family TonB-linked outer membrane protein n=1 Tax=Spirosoma montaniterrae TaxID=1178516 RepID=A0A1P9WXK1_9BACT|nr:TonB-dependent receptor [Spirosoma montaniterrae]AQG80091.1 SusC/RagA family TonB-linked outer membrane protein [Spirosoma montaniterrae]